MAAGNQCMFPLCCYAHLCVKCRSPHCSAECPQQSSCLLHQTNLHFLAWHDMVATTHLWLYCMRGALEQHLPPTLEMIIKSGFCASIRSSPPNFIVYQEVKGQAWWHCGLIVIWGRTFIWHNYDWLPSSPLTVATVMSYQISLLELITVLPACKVWSSTWCATWERCLCDSQAFICTIAGRFSHDPTIIHLLNYLFIMEA